MRTSGDKKDKLLIIFDEESYVLTVGGLLVSASRWILAILKGVLNKSQQGFFFVDKRFEISNHELIKDIVEIMEIDKSIIFF